MTEDEAKKIVAEVLHRFDATGVQPVYIVDEMEREHNWTRAVGDLILHGACYGTNTMGWRDGAKRHFKQ